MFVTFMPRRSLRCTRRLFSSDLKVRRSPIVFAERALNACQEPDLYVPKTIQTSNTVPGTAPFQIAKCKLRRQKDFLKSRAAGMRYAG